MLITATGNNGDVVATYNYDEFGNLKSSTTPNGGQAGSIYNPLRYSGANNAYYDSETGLYKMGCRYYMAEVGRWLTRDTDQGESQSPQSLNKYVYCENNPVNYIDPTGMWHIHLSGRRIRMLRFQLGYYVYWDFAGYFCSRVLPWPVKKLFGRYYRKFRTIRRMLYPYRYKGATIARGYYRHGSAYFYVKGRRRRSRRGPRLDWIGWQQLFAMLAMRG